MSKWRKGRLPWHTRGFTLVEILVVIGIFGILAAIAIPDWGTLLPTYRLNGAARQVQSELHETKSRAVSENTSFQLNVPSAPTNSYQVQRAGTPLATKPLPQGIEIIEAVTVSFTSHGTATSNRVRLKNVKGACRQVVVSSTGRIRICKPSACNVNC